MSGDRKIRWGVLGCARIAEKAFIPGVLKSPNGVLGAIAARDPARAEDWARRFGFARARRTYQELVDDPGIDAVYNPLPNDLHAEWSIRALRAGKHVLCEKPMALNAPEVLAMIRTAGTCGALLMEGFMYKFHPQIERTVEIVRAGVLGPVRSVHATFTFRYTGDAANYRWSPAQGGGALYDVGCYTTSAARLVFDAEPVAVTAAARLDPATGVDMTAALLLEFPGGRFALCDASFESHFQSRLLAAGADAVLRLDRAFSAKDFDTAVEIVRGDAVERRPVPKADMFALMIEHFDAAALGEVPLRVPPSDAWSNMRAIDAAFESLRTGGRVVIPGMAGERSPS